MPSTITQSVDVDVPITTVYNQWTQFESFPQFMGGVDEITQTDDRHTHWKTTIGGVSREFDTEITEQHPEERVAWKSTDGTTHAVAMPDARCSRLSIGRSARRIRAREPRSSPTTAPARTGRPSAARHSIRQSHAWATASA